MICPLCGEAIEAWSYTGKDGGASVIGAPSTHTSECLMRETPPVISPNRVYNADCVSSMKLIPDNSIDLIVSDPPYLINYQTNRRKDKTHDFCSPIQNDNAPDLIEKYIQECYRILKPDHACYLFCSAKTTEIFKNFAEKARFSIRNTIIWYKNCWTSGDLKAQFGQQYEVILLLNKGRAPFKGKRIGDVWEFSRVTGKNQLHQNQKPVDLIRRCIEKHSDPHDLVFDGFMGSGTTAVAAYQMDRQFLGFEIEPRYFWMIHNRLLSVEKEVQDSADP